MREAWLVSLCVFVASPALAQVRLGVRGGASGSPGIGWAGVQLQSSTWLRLGFRQSLDVGLGSRTALGSDTEVLLHLPRVGIQWIPYVGTGTSAIIASSGGHSDQSGYVGGGPVAVIGVQHKSGLFVDAHVAITGYGYRTLPVRLSVGYVIPRRPKPK